MTDNSSWVYQGRQQHGWFGTGTSPTGGAPPSAAAGWLPPLTLGERLKYVLGGVFARVPSRDRPRWSSVLASSASLERAVQAWSDASGLGRDAFRSRLLDHYANDETVDQLRRAASGIVKGKTYDDLSTASDSLAEAAVSIGSDNWARFVASAGRRAPEGGFAGEGDSPGNFHILDPVYSHAPPPVRLVADATRPDIPEAALALRIIVGRVIEAEEASPTIPRWCPRKRMGRCCTPGSSRRSLRLTCLDLRLKHHIRTEQLRNTEILGLLGQMWCLGMLIAT